LRHPRWLFVVRWLLVVVALAVVFTVIWAGAMRGRAMHFVEMETRRAEGAEEAEARAKQRESMTNEEIATEHAMVVEILDGLQHPHEEFHGKTAYPLFTEDYYRDPEGYQRQWRKDRDWSE
jgi:hypothetical protein